MILNAPSDPHNRGHRNVPQRTSLLCRAAPLYCLSPHISAAPADQMDSTFPNIWAVIGRRGAGVPGTRWPGRTSNLLLTAVTKTDGSGGKRTGREGDSRSPAHRPTHRPAGVSQLISPATDPCQSVSGIDRTDDLTLSDWPPPLHRSLFRI